MNFYANLPVSETGIDLEEAYVVTTTLPEGWQIKGGKFKNNFSRLDSQHPHAWDFRDTALPYRAFLGNVIRAAIKTSLAGYYTCASGGTAQGDLSYPYLINIDGLDIL
ncbi:MAG TPA: hypothetical protein VLX29_00385 [Nitrospirota bacterium]|nr:hypothetical protein [Nitrospirota bacterium]